MTTLSATVACLYQKILREYSQIDIDSSAYTCFLLDYHSHALAEIVKAYVNKKKSSSTTRLSNHDNYWKETTMTFISNHKQKIISSYISATVSSHPELEKHPTLPLVYQKNRNPHQVPILSGGGSGSRTLRILDMWEKECLPLLSMANYLLRLQELKS